MKCDLVFSVPCLRSRTRAAAGSSVHVSVLHLKQQKTFLWWRIFLFICETEWNYFVVVFFSGQKKHSEKFS